MFYQNFLRLISVSCIVALWLSVLAEGGNVAPYTISLHHPTNTYTIINFGDIVVSYQGSTVSGTCALHTPHPSYPSNYCCDGNPNSFCSTNENLGTNVAKFTASFNNVFDKVILYNRLDCCGDRMVGLTMTIYDALNATIYETVFSANSQTYTITDISIDTSTFAPTTFPTASPTVAPSSNPTVDPTAAPTVAPTVDPTAVPTTSPSPAPSTTPTEFPTSAPTTNPTEIPTAIPTPAPIANPTALPTEFPTANPTVDPTAIPSTAPTQNPTASPTQLPTPARGIIGFDYRGAAALSDDQMKCLHETNNLNFFIARGYFTKGDSLSTAKSMVDPNLCNNLRLAIRNNVTVRGITILPKPGFGLSPSTPVKELMRMLVKQCPGFTSVAQHFNHKLRIWLGVLENGVQYNGWSSNYLANRRWYESAMKSCQYYFGDSNCGVYASASAWAEVFNDASYYNASVYKRAPLWYSTASSSSAMSDSPSFKDFRDGGVSIGAWTAPELKNFKKITDGSLCGVNVGLDWGWL